MDRKRKAILFLLTETPTWVYDEMVTEWVHPINNERETFGEFQHLYKELRMDDPAFRIMIIDSQVIKVSSLANLSTCI